MTCLDRKLTIQGINSAIKHLKSGKATGTDDSRNECIPYGKKTAETNITTIN